MTEIVTKTSKKGKIFVTYCVRDAHLPEELVQKFEELAAIEDGGLKVLIRKESKPRLPMSCSVSMECIKDDGEWIAMCTAKAVIKINEIFKLNEQLMEFESLFS